MEDLISIIIPAYNAEKYIENCLKKVLSQSYSNIEVIVVNDGSTDNTLNIAENYQKKDSRVRVLSQKNSGTSVARINGMQDSKGKYILFLDSDDFYVDDAIKKLALLAKKYDPDLIRFRYQTYPALSPQRLIIKECTEDVFIQKDEFKDKIYPLYITSYSLNSICLLMIKREKFKIKDINEYSNLRFAEDMKFSMELFDSADNVLITSSIFYNYYTNYSSTTKSNDIHKILRNIHDFAIAYSSVYDYMKKWQIDTPYYLKKMDIKVLEEASNFYMKLDTCNDMAYVKENLKEITELLYSGIVLNAISNLKEDDLDKNYIFYNYMIKIYRKDNLF